MKISKISLATVLMMGVAACGGTTQPPPRYVPPPPPPPTKTPDEFRTAEFNRNWSLGAIKAEYAYADGYTGAGQLVGFVDFNFDFTATDVVYHGSSLDKDLDNIAIYEAQIGQEAPSSPHGHAVAVVAAGVKDDVATHGVAFDSRVLAVDYFSGVYNRDVTQNGVTYHISDPYSYIIDRGARIISISIGYDEEDIISNPPVVTEAYRVQNAAITIERGGLLIAAAGNDADPDPMLSNIEIKNLADDHGLLINGPGAYLIVGSVDENNVISSFSDRAGVTKDIYLVAPGEGIVAPWTTEEDGPGLYTVQGTSFAAPHVAGAAAIILDRWPTLTAKQVADILLSTATDLGAVGVDEVYGHGMLDLESALTPQGALNVTMFGGTSSVGLGDFSLVLGAPFGDGTPIGLNSVMGLDKFDRDFYFDLSSGVYNLAASRQPIFSFMEQTNKIQFNQWQAGNKTLGLQVSQDFSEGFLDAQSQWAKDTVRQTRVVSGFADGKFSKTWGWKLGLGTGLKAPLSKSSNSAQLMSSQSVDGYLSANGSYGLVEHDINEKTKISLGFDVSANRGLHWLEASPMREDLTRYSYAVQFDKSLDGLGFGLKFGQLHEKQSVLGSRSFGGFAVADSATTSFVGVDGYWDISSNFAVSASMEMGVTDVSEVAGSFFEGFNSFASSAWQVEFEARDLGFANSSMVLSASQPLRVENAVLTRHQAVGVSFDNSPVYDQVSASFSPSGREVAVEAAYVVHGHTWSLQASLMQRFNAGHSQGVSDTAGLIWLKRSF